VIVPAFASPVACVMLVLPQAYSFATGVSGPRATFSNSNSVIGRNPAQSANAAPSAQLM
jgi:hypothetical protein